MRTENRREVKKGLVTNATVLNKYTNTQKQELHVQEEIQLDPTATGSKIRWLRDKML